MQREKEKATWKDEELGKRKERSPAGRDRETRTVGREQGSHTVTAVTGWSKI